MAAFTEDDLRFFDENGYVTLGEAVPPENCRAVIDALFAFLEMDPDDPDDWYRSPLNRGGMTEMYQHQALWNNRQHPRLHEAFSQILGTEKLWVSIDRANFNPPEREDRPEYGHEGFIHWDMDTRTMPSAVDGRAPLGVQGVLYLTDTPAERGGFRCVPGHHLLLQRWARTKEPIPGAPSETNPGAPCSLQGLNVIPVLGEAGDLVIWDRRLLHGNGRNVSDQPRFAQYLSMGRAPAWGDPAAEERRQERIRQWQERRPPRGSWVVGDPRGWEPAHCAPAALTPLGRRLLGLDPWP